MALTEWIDKETIKKIKAVGERFGVKNYSFKYYPYECEVNGIQIYLSGFYKSAYYNKPKKTPCPFQIREMTTIRSMRGYTSHILAVKSAMGFVAEVQKIAIDWNKEHFKETE